MAYQLLYDLYPAGTGMQQANKTIFSFNVLVQNSNAAIKTLKVLSIITVVA